MSNLWGNLQPAKVSQETLRPPSSEKLVTPAPATEHSRRSSVMDELVRQSRVFFDDFADETEAPSEDNLTETEDELLSDQDAGSDIAS